MQSSAATPSRSDVRQVGFIGLGDMGGAIATRIIDAGFATWLFGAGQYAKLINNALLAANLAVGDDALSLAEALGIPPDALAEVVRHGSGRSFGFGVALAARMAADIRQRTTTPLRKDVSCLTVQAPRECADAALFTRAARQGVERLSLPPGWER